MNVSVFYQIQRGLNLKEYEPHSVGSQIVANPAQTRHYSSNARESHPRGSPTGVGLTCTQVSVPWGVNYITSSLRNNNAQRKK